jgi:DNA-binding LytR/AlgR family response regulator
MNKFSCIIVDDETLARELLVDHCQKIPDLEIKALCSNAIAAKTALEQFTPDILFLDIQMPDLSGFELLRILKKQPATIITTAFSEYAIEGYELDVLDYLLKPIEFDRFFKAVSKAIEWLKRGNETQLTDTNLALINSSLEVKENSFFVKSDYKTVKVVYDEILYIEALQKYVRIHTVHQRIVTMMSMSSLEELLPKAGFLRIHRSYIANLKKIDSIEGNTIHIGKYQLPVSKGQKEDLLKWVKGN